MARWRSLKRQTAFNSWLYCDVSDSNKFDIIFLKLNTSGSMHHLIHIFTFKFTLLGLFQYEFRLSESMLTQLDMMLLNAKYLIQAIHELNRVLHKLLQHIFMKWSKLPRCSLLIEVHFSIPLRESKARSG